ncbi:MAG: hypothetical protein QMC67_01710 [Candidatus Wallbacteria bacterium]
MNKFLVSFMLSFIVIFFAKNAFATMPGFEIPKWYSVDVKIVKPLDLQKKDDFGTLRFVFTPLIKADFEISVSAKGFKNLKITPETGKLHSKNMKEASIDFNFNAVSEIYESGYIEFNVNYPEKALLDIVSQKYGNSIPEAKELSAKIKKYEQKFNSSIAADVYIARSENAVSPEVYFGETDARGFFYLKTDTNENIVKAKETLKNFNEQYGSALGLNIVEFKSFIKETKAGFSNDIGGYLKAAYIVEKNDKKVNAADMKLTPEKVIELLKACRETEEKTFNNEIRESYLKAGLYNAAYFNLLYLKEFNSNKDGKAFLKLKSMIDCYMKLKCNQKRGFLELISYLNFNAGLILKETGGKDYEKYFNAAQVMNHGIIVRK